MSNFSLKVLAGIFMLLGHLHMFIAGMPAWFEKAGMIATPIFLFCMVEGFYYASSRKKYLDRLLWGAIIVALGGCALELILERNISLYENLFFSLAIGLVFMNSIEFMKSSNKSVESVLMFAGTIIISLFFEESLVPLTIVAIFYFFRCNKKSMIISYILFIIVSSIALNSDIISEVGLTYVNQDFIWVMVFSIIPIMMYKGRKGAFARKYKKILYILYPTHIWLLYIIGCFIN